MDLSEAIVTYLARREAGRISRSRLYEDRRALKLLLEAMSDRLRGSGSIPVSAVTKEDLLGTLEALRARPRPFTNHYLNVFVSSWRVFFEDLHRRALILINPTETLRHAKGESLPRDVPSQEEMRRLLQTPDITTDTGIRDVAILELLYGSGLRRIELFKLEIRDVDLSERRVFVRSGKGQKDRVVPMTEEAARWIAAYLRVRPSTSRPNLFLSPLSHRELEGNAFRLHTRELFQKAGLPKLTPHGIRHACALHLLENGADIVSVKNLLGHARLETTAIYFRLTTSHIKKLLERSHPRG